MRSDFNKVLTEDPRRGSDWKFREIRHKKGNATIDEEFKGGKESMMKRRRIGRGERKRFGDLLSPLEGWVRKQVGKNWDAVYSEVCQKFDRRSQIADHVHQHIFDDFVEVNTKFIDGKVCVLNRWDGWQDVNEGLRRGKTFYVHPITGVLCTTVKDKEAGHKERARERREASVNSVFRVVDRDHHLFLIDDVWWLFKMEDMPPARLEYRCPYWYNTIQRTAWYALPIEERDKTGQATWVRPAVNAVPAPRSCPGQRYYAEKRTASRKILKRFGLVGISE